MLHNVIFPGEETADWGLMCIHVGLLGTRGRRSSVCLVTIPGLPRTSKCEPVSLIPTRASETAIELLISDQSVA